MVTRGFKMMMAEANAVIDTVSVQDALRLIDDPGAVFVDVRETVELQREGTIPGAVHAPRGLLEFIADPASPMHHQALSSGKRLVLFCASGGRSTFAARTLTEMGIGDVCHVAGGYSAWRHAGGPIERMA
jgi:rhodanese-related sulfurtransferase